MGCDPGSALTPRLSLRDGKTEVLARIIRGKRGAAIRRALVVGCGSGVEAAILGRELGAAVVGIDVVADFDSSAASMVDLREGDATSLEFADGEFDLVYSFHAIEHIPDYRRALSEMRRVLEADGCYCIGTPNRQRIVGYLGSKTATTAEKVKWNVKDWRDRLAGRFTNEEGAHAGFIAEELEVELLRHFSSAENIGPRYYTEKTHPSRARTLRYVLASGLGRYAFPAVYFYGRA